MSEPPGPSPIRAFDADHQPRGPRPWVGLALAVVVVAAGAVILATSGQGTQTAASTPDELLSETTVAPITTTTSSPTTPSTTSPTDTSFTAAVSSPWSRVPHDEAVFGGAGWQEMSGVTAGGPGLVAVGGEASGQRFDGAVWTSSDGITLSRVPHDEAVFGGGEVVDGDFGREGDQRMASVIAGGPGLVVVESDESRDTAVWVLATEE